MRLNEASSKFAFALHMTRDYRINHNYKKILESDWLSTAPISALILNSLTGQYAPSRASLNGFFSLLAKISWNFLCFNLKKEPNIYITNFVRVMINW